MTAEGGRPVGRREQKSVDTALGLAFLILLLWYGFGVLCHTQQAVTKELKRENTERGHIPPSEWRPPFLRAAVGLAAAPLGNGGHGRWGGRRVQPHRLDLNSVAPMTRRRDQQL
jgi:hypothetical protein